MPKKILLIVEGEKREPDLVKAMFSIYGLTDSFEIFSYESNIHVLYDLLVKNGGSEGFDLLPSLRAISKNEREKKILSESYTDIILIFDYDPNDARYEMRRLRTLIEYFSDSTDNGKLYINYPMVESFFHLKARFGMDFLTSRVPREDMKNSKAYRTFVSKESYIKNFNHFPKDIKEWNWIIKTNIQKSAILTSSSDTTAPASQISIFDEESYIFGKGEEIYDLCTCIFFIFDYQPKLLEEDS